jgi:hypothetical protein
VRVGVGVRAADARVREIAERQHGAFRRDQAIRAGLSQAAASRRVSDGEWARMHEGVYRIAGAQLAWRGALLAACLAGGNGAVGSHRSAARVYDIPGGRFDGVEITCPRWRRARHEGLVIHETGALDSWDLRVIDEIPVTSIERTLLDLGAVVGPALVEMAVDVALRRKLTTLPRLRGVLGRLGRSGRNGAGVLRRIVDPRDPGQPAPESPWETRMLQVLRRHDLPAPVPQHEIYTSDGVFVARVDAAFPQWRIALEYQSLQHHVGAEAVLRDDRRRRRLFALGWSLVPTDVDDLRGGGRGLVAAIRGILASNPAR